MLRVLILHNRYQIAGGEDVVVQQEAEMLSKNGVAAEVFVVDNDSITSTWESVRAAKDSFYSKSMHAEVSKIIRRFRPDVVHVHNFMPRLSPSVYHAAHSEGCAVVQTLHNYRLICANAQLFRDGKICDDCVGRSFGWPGVIHRCYRDSLLGSGVIAGMTAWHAKRGTWKTDVDRYIVLTEFARDVFVRSGILPADRIVVKPNAVADPGNGSGSGNYLLYVGRLSPEKGIEVVLQAAQQGAGFGLPLKIAGAGPLEALVRDAAGNGKVEFLGNRNRADIYQLMQNASALLFPSLWYEGLPMVLVEAFATGLPIIASKIGAMAQLITHEKDGLLVEPGSAEGFQAAVGRLLSSSELTASMRKNARASYQATYTPDINLQMLLQVYKEAAQLN
jgi:glycosyltransferase involved in cell wall biosynthesis